MSKAIMKSYDIETWRKVVTSTGFNAKKHCRNYLVHTMKTTEER